jgi:hypothetical protein
MMGSAVPTLSVGARPGGTYRGGTAVHDGRGGDRVGHRAEAQRDPGRLKRGDEAVSVSHRVGPPRRSPTTLPVRRESLVRGLSAREQIHAGVEALMQKYAREFGGLGRAVHRRRVGSDPALRTAAGRDQPVGPPGTRDGVEAQGDARAHGRHEGGDSRTPSPAWPPAAVRGSSGAVEPGRRRRRSSATLCGPPRGRDRRRP